MRLSRLLAFLLRPLSISWLRLVLQRQKSRLHMVDRDSSVKCFYLRPYFSCALFINWNFNRNRFAENIWSTWRRSCPHQRRLALDAVRSGPHGFSSAPKVFCCSRDFHFIFSETCLLFGCCSTCFLTFPSLASLVWGRAENHPPSQNSSGAFPAICNQGEWISGNSFASFYPRYADEGSQKKRTKQLACAWKGHAKAAVSWLVFINISFRLSMFA